MGVPACFSRLPNKYKRWKPMIWRNSSMYPAPPAAPPRPMKKPPLLGMIKQRHPKPRWTPTEGTRQPGSPDA